MREADKVIREVLHVRRGDTLPYSSHRYKATRDDFPALFARLGFTIGAEIGVSKGAFSEALCQGIINLRLFCVDPWIPYGGLSAEGAESHYERTKALLSPYNAEIIRKRSIEAAQEVYDGSLDFVYIDGAHDFDNVMQDIIVWAKKVRPGGIVAGHDYFHFYQSGVVRAVDAYTLAHGINPWYVTREDMPSWLWVR